MKYGYAFIILTVLYFLGGTLGLKFYPMADFATLVWPPAGISLAFLILFGPRLWPAVTLGSFLVNTVAGASPLIALGIAMGSTLGIVSGAYLFNKWIKKDDHNLRTVKAAGFFVLLGAFASAVVSSLIGALMLTAFKDANFYKVFQFWAIGDFLSLLILTPLILSLVKEVYQETMTKREYVEFGILVVVTALSASQIFGYDSGVGVFRYGLTFLLFPLLIWASARFQMWQTMVVVIIVCVIAIRSTIAGVGPFTGAAPEYNLLFLQFFIGSFALIAIALASAMAEKSAVQENLQVNYNFLNSITENISDAIYVKDLQGKYLFINPYGAKAMGGTVKDVIGKTDSDFFEKSGETLRANDREIIESRIPKTFEDTVQSNGREYTFLTKKVPFLDRHQNVAGVLGISRDITDRKQIELARSESEMRFRSLADQAPVLIWSSGPDKLCDWFNEPWLKFTGRTMEQELGNGWAEGVHPEDLDRCLRIYTGSFDERQSFTMEYRLRRYDGEYRWVVDHGVPHYSHDNKFLGFLGTCVDFHERHQLEGTLKEALRIRDEFLSIASHELKTPLTSLSLQAQLLLRQITIPELHQKLDSAFKQIDKLNTLIEDLLDVSRIRTGRLRFVVEDFELGHAIQEVIERFQQQAQYNGVELHYSLPVPTIVKWDKQRFDQVLSNLISNGIKYGDRRPLKIHVEPGLETVEIIVKDSGIGIKTEDQQRIFERFERAVSSRHFGGLGMGLYIVKQIVKAHGGDIRVESEFGKGSSFILRMPIQALIQEIDTSL